MKNQLRSGQLTNPVGWVLIMLKRTCYEQLVLTKAAMPTERTPIQSMPSMPIGASGNHPQSTERATSQQVVGVIAHIRSKFFSKRLID
ncbi:hypothetical protein ABK905_22525 [Acerihabitans sp. KWT182]|uniref:Uncharacterized protein n=1 Tax=Acerihabitans sp. KWT182 TaxID=3157919 RepID=A0AAU7Q932_9GAMM